MTNQEFWNCFDELKTGLEEVILGKSKDYSKYDELTEKLNDYSPHLLPELTQNEDNKFVLIISCDGIKEGIPFVEQLVDNAKIFDNWIILKYRQPGPMELIPLDGLILKRKHIFLTWDKDSTNKYDLIFYIKGYSANDHRYESATVLHMDHTIGEYNSMTKVRDLHFKKLGLFQSRKNLNTLDDFKAELDKNFT